MEQNNIHEHPAVKQAMERASIYEHPAVKPLWDEYCRRSTLAEKDAIMPELLAAMGEVQKERGQRTKDRYMK